MDLNEIGFEVVVQIRMAEDMNGLRALVITVINLWVPRKGRNFLTS
jgi:hypothetical protein